MIQTPHHGHKYTFRHIVFMLLMIQKLHHGHKYTFRHIVFMILMIQTPDHGHKYTFRHIVCMLLMIKSCIKHHGHKYTFAMTKAYTDGASFQNLRLYSHQQLAPIYSCCCHCVALCQKNTIHQVTTMLKKNKKTNMLATSNKSYFQVITIC